MAFLVGVADVAGEPSSRRERVSRRRWSSRPCLERRLLDAHSWATGEGIAPFHPTVQQSRNPARKYPAPGEQAGRTGIPILSPWADNGYHTLHRLAPPFSLVCVPNDFVNIPPAPRTILGHLPPDWKRPTGGQLLLVGRLHPPSSPSR